jgi:hypothetical protein
MPREIRQIILTKEELVGAINSYKRTSPEALPQGDVLSYAVNPNGGLKLRMKIYYGASGQQIEIDLDERHVIQILVKFCLENNIMLPRNSSRSYKVINEEFVLIIKINMLD